MNQELSYENASCSGIRIAFQPRCAYCQRNECPKLAPPWLIPPSILANADLLVTKTAFVAGMVAPETAACLSRLLITLTPIIQGSSTGTIQS